MDSLINAFNISLTYHMETKACHNDPKPKKDAEGFPDTYDCLITKETFKVLVPEISYINHYESDRS